MVKVKHKNIILKNLKIIGVILLVILIICVAIGAGQFAFWLTFALLKIMPPLANQFQIYITIMVFQGALATISFNASNNTTEDKVVKKKFYNIALGFFFGLINFGLALLSKHILETYMVIPKLAELNSNQPPDLPFIIFLVVSFLVIGFMFLFIIFTSISLAKLWWLLNKLRDNYQFK